MLTWRKWQVTDQIGENGCLKVVKLAWLLPKYERPWTELELVEEVIRMDSIIRKQSYLQWHGLTCSDKALCSGKVHRRVRLQTNLTYGIATLFGALATSLHWNIIDLQTGAKMSSWLRQRPSLDISSKSWRVKCQRGQRGRVHVTQDLKTSQCGKEITESHHKGRNSETKCRNAFWDLSSHNRATQL